MSKLLWGGHEKEEISGALGRARERWGGTLDDGQGA